MKNELSALVVIWHREMLRYVRNRTRILTSLLQPLLFLAIFGSGLRQSLSGPGVGGDFLKFMYPGIVAMGIMGMAMTSAISIVWDREFGFLKEILVAPVARTTIAFGKAIGGTSTALIQAILLLALTPLLGIRLTAVDLAELLGLGALLSFAVSGLGILVASRMKSVESFGLVMQFVLFPMFFLSGAFFPLQRTPPWMRLLTRANPLAYGVDAFRGVLLGAHSPALLRSVPANVAWLVGFSVVFMTLAVWQFRRMD